MKGKDLQSDEYGFLSLLACFFVAVVLLLGGGLVYFAAREGSENLEYQRETQLDWLLEGAMLHAGGQLQPEEVEGRTSNDGSGKENRLLHEEERAGYGRPLHIRIYGREKDGYLILMGSIDSLLPSRRVEPGRRRVKKMLWKKRTGAEHEGVEKGYVDYRRLQ